MVRDGFYIDSRPRWAAVHRRWLCSDPWVGAVGTCLLSLRRCGLAVSGACGAAGRVLWLLAAAVYLEPVGPQAGLSRRRVCSAGTGAGATAQGGPRREPRAAGCMPK
eukprot:5415887-Prymnesium_polylepis.2